DPVQPRERTGRIRDVDPDPRVERECLTVEANGDRRPRVLLDPGPLLADLHRADAIVESDSGPRGARRDTRAEQTRHGQPDERRPPTRRHRARAYAELRDHPKDIPEPTEPAGAEGLEPPAYGFGDRRSTN